jgi:hypothetical protein
MVSIPTSRHSDSDPRRLRELFIRTGAMASRHSVPSVIVGVAGREGDLLMPELIGFVESALRVEDAIFRMTRERAVLFLADSDRSRAEQIVERLIADFQARFAAAEDLEVELGYFEVPPGAQYPCAKEVLPAVFGPAPTGQPS